MREQPELIENTVEEILRYDSPVTTTGRITHADVAVGGCPIGRGETLTLSLSAANRDPEIFAEPDRFDITRDNTAHQAFGGGRHHCLGATLARCEAREAISRLISRFPSLLMSERGFRHSRVPGFRGMDYCWLKTGT